MCMLGCIQFFFCKFSIFINFKSLISHNNNNNNNFKSGIVSSHTCVPPHIYLGNTQRDANFLNYNLYCLPVCRDRGWLDCVHSLEARQHCIEGTEDTHKRYEQCSQLDIRVQNFEVPVFEFNSRIKYVKQITNAFICVKVTRDYFYLSLRIVKV